ncbi:hypothetical protein M1116_01050 [Patescibacteria group bacterium]|nr:hypothetical protein [Patescibacteria group bacterium]
MNFIKFKPFLVVSLFTVIPTLLLWIMFHFNLPRQIGFSSVDLKTIFANYDGPNYLVIAKCGYDKNCIRTHFSLPTPLEYYPAHLPGFPLLIRLFDVVLPSPVAMILLTLLGSVILNYAFYLLSGSLWLTFAFTLFPGRLFILRSIGAPETMFIGFILWSIIFFRQKKYILSALCAVLVQLLKSPGILLFVAYFLLAVYEFWTHKSSLGSVVRRFGTYLLIPLSALLVFYLYYLQTGDFLAYFHSGDNIHLNPIPYLAFVSTKSWVNGIWLEDILYIFLLALFGVGRLIGKYKFDILAVFPAIFLIATLLVAHRDISRYASPIYPFLFLAFAPHLKTKAFKFALLLLIPAIYLYAINFIIGNTAPIADWTPYL